MDKTFSLDELRSRNLDRLRADRLIEITIEDEEKPVTEKERADIERIMEASRRYFRRFLEPVGRENGNSITGTMKCVACDTLLDGFVGSFTFDLTYGEGRCGACGYPCRSHHRIRDESGTEVLFLQYILQYHPDELERKNLQ